MKYILLSQNGSKYSGVYRAIVDDADFGWLTSGQWFAHVRKRTSGPYVSAIRNVPLGGMAWMHREIFERQNGPVPDGYTVDHREHGEYGGLDNRRSNLRLASGLDQQGNRRKQANTTSMYKGVSWDARRGLWRANLGVDYRQLSLGRFSSEEEAARAYDSAAVSYFGEFAKLNFPAPQC